MRRTAFNKDAAAAALLLAELALDCKRRGVTVGQHLESLYRQFGYFKNTLAMQATYTPDIWVSSHAGQFNLHKVYKPGDAYNPARFGDLAAFNHRGGRASEP